MMIVYIKKAWMADLASRLFYFLDKWESVGNSFVQNDMNDEAGNYQYQRKTQCGIVVNIGCAEACY